MTSTGTMFVPSFMKIRNFVQNLLGQTRGHDETTSLSSLTNYVKWVNKKWLGSKTEPLIII